MSFNYENSVGILGIGSYYPNKVLTNEEISNKNEKTNSKWIVENLGIHERRILNEDEFVSDMAYNAANKAIQDANIDKEDIDLLILSTSTPDKLAPSTAMITSKKLCIKIPAFDINAVCGGFIYAIQIASNFVSTSKYKNVLVISADAYSKITNWEDRNCVFFGDGAGAVIISKIKNSWIDTEIYGDPFGFDGAYGDSFSCDLNKKFLMNPSLVYKFATQSIPTAINKILNKHKINKESIKWIIPHQPGHRILYKTSEILDFPTEKIVFNMKHFANTASASIPMALDSIYKSKKLVNGDMILMPSVGSGWVWGVSLLKYFKQ